MKSFSRFVLISLVFSLLCLTGMVSAQEPDQIIGMTLETNDLSLNIGESYRFLPDFQTIFPAISRKPVGPADIAAAVGILKEQVSERDDCIIPRTQRIEKLTVIPSHIRTVPVARAGHSQMHQRGAVDPAPASILRISQLTALKESVPVVGVYQ